MAHSLTGLGEVSVSEGNYDAARALLKESLQIQREQGDKWGEAYTLGILGQLAARESNMQQGRQLLVESLRLRRELGDKQGMALCLIGLAEVAKASADLVRAANLLGAAESLLEGLNIHETLAEQIEHSRISEGIRVELGDTNFHTATLEGKNLPLDHVQALASEQLPGLNPPSRKSYLDGMSRREVEVLRLVAAGLSDAEVAASLHLSHHTVHAHLRTIFKKIGVTSRGGATRYAVEQGLT